MSLGDRLKELRTVNQMSVRDVAQKLQKSPGYISRLETRGEIPSPEFLIQIAELYQAELAELLLLSKTDLMNRTSTEIDERQQTALALYRKARNL